MGVIQAEDVKIPNSVLVGGLTGEVIDNEVIDYLGQCGPIGRVIKLTSSEALFKDTAIVEFKPSFSFCRALCPARDPLVIQTLLTTFSMQLIKVQP